MADIHQFKIMRQSKAMLQPLADFICVLKNPKKEICKNHVEMPYVKRSFYLPFQHHCHISTQLKKSLLINISPHCDFIQSALGKGA